MLQSMIAAHPQVADYPFTTKEPQLGVVSLGIGQSFVVADLPGLIEGAHRGVGLGHEFLRHVSRTRVLVHLVDVGTEKPAADLVRDYEAILAELKLYDEDLLSRPRILAGNKMDLPGARERFEALRRHAAKGKAKLPRKNCVAVSALTGEGVNALAREMQRLLATAPAPALKLPEPVVVLNPRGRRRVKVVRDQRGRLLVRGRELERLVAGMEGDKAGLERRLKAHFGRLGVEEALASAGARKGDKVRIGDLEFEYLPEVEAT